MDRNLDSDLAAGLDAKVILPFVLGEIRFKSGRANAWSGIGSLSWDSKTWLGLGALLDVGSVSEGSAVEAQGTTVTLAGIGKAFGSATMVQEALTDIRLGAPVKLWFGLMSSTTGAMIGSPYLYFAGTVDKPTVVTDPETGTAITLALENRLNNLQRPSNRKYTSADQRLEYPDDMFFDWVEILQDIALREGN
jgi:hypothetical protein